MAMWDRGHTERLPKVDGREWPDFGNPGPGTWGEKTTPPAWVFTDSQGLRWDIVWHEDTWKKTPSQTGLGAPEIEFEGQA